MHAPSAGTQFGAHVATHHLHRRFAQGRVDGSYRVGRDNHIEVAHIGVERAVENALLGNLAAQDQLSRSEAPQQVLQGEA